MAGVGRDWRDRVAEHRTVERHTREVRDVPPEILNRLEALEAFAQAAADKLNRIDLLVCELQKKLDEHSHDFSAVVRVA